MARVQKAHSTDTWPQEGLSIIDTAIRIGGTDRWAALDKARRERQPVPIPWELLLVPPYKLTADQLRRRIAFEHTKAPVLQAEAAFVEPLLTAWNAGQVVAQGRRGNPLVAPVEIPPPVTGWEFWIVDLDQSTIRAKIRGRKIIREKIFDLRFWPKDLAPTPAAPMFAPAAKLSTKEWIVAEVERITAAGEIPPGIGITAFSKLLSDRMAKDTRVQAVTWGTIKNRLPSLGLWPIP